MYKYSLRDEASQVYIDEKNQSSEKSGSTEMGNREWFWTIKPINTADGMLRALDVIVWQDINKKNPLLTVRTYAAVK